MDWSQIKHFKPEEFLCPCCGREEMAQGFMEALDSLRDDLGQPLIVNSGWRCVANEIAKGRSGKSAHTTGQAADLAIWGYHALQLVHIAGTLDFRGIGLKQHGDIDRRFIHLDTLEGSPSQPRPHIWTYP